MGIKKYSGLLAVLLVGTALFAVCFHGYISGEKVLLSTDALIAHSNITFQEMVHSIGPRWRSTPLIGIQRGGGTSLAWITKGLVGNGIIWNNFFYGSMCLVSFIILSTWLRRRGLSLSVSICGALAAVWLGSNFTLLYPGHAHKPVVVLFFICSLLPAARAAAGSIVYSVIWGACVGLMFVQQPDIALFFALFAGAYYVFLLSKEQGFKVLQWLKVLVPAAVVALLFAVGPLLGGYEMFVKGAAQMQTDNKEQKWNYVTQWSVPPNEMIDFVAPGYYGWRSGDPEGPYWGRTGRTPGWEKTHQGFQNFKLESTYIGFIPVAFALFALFACRRSKHKSEILFWAGAAVVALMLSFGRYFPLYSLFYKLPVVNNIRNPNKFIQVFQVCLAILAAYGFDALWRSREDDGEQNRMDKPIRAFFWTSIGLLSLLGLWALAATLGREGAADKLVSAAWPQEAAGTIAQNKATALRHAVFMAAGTSAVFAVFTFRKFAAAVRYRTVIASIVVLLVAVDAVKLSEHYIQEMPRSYIEANALTDYLEANLGDRRVALLSQDGINNIWITYLFPYNRIPCFNFTDMPRMANDYKALLSAGQRNPLNLWRFSAVKYLLAPSAMEQQLAQAGCKKIFAYGLVGTGGQEFEVRAHPNGPYAVYELQGGLPRYALFAGSRKEADQQILTGALSDMNVIHLPEDTLLPELEGTGREGSVQTVSSRPGRVRLKVNAAVPTILRAAEKYDPAWKARIDGKPAELDRVDYLCQGVAVPAGEHEVELRYAPSRFYFNLQLLGFGLLLAALIAAGFQRKVGDAAD